MYGKQVRMAQLFKKKNMFIVPLDHAVTYGPIKGLQNCTKTIEALKNTGIDTFILHKGILRKVIKMESLQGIPLIMHLSGSIYSGVEATNKILVAQVEEAIKMGALGVSIQVNLNNQYTSKMLGDFSNVSKACDEWGIPLLAMMYSKGDTSIIHAARVAEELGADIVKVSCPNKDGLESLLTSISIPVVVSGGEYSENAEKFLTSIDSVISMGISGVAIGRNIFQRSNAPDFAKKIDKIVHRRREMV